MTSRALTRAATRLVLALVVALATMLGLGTTAHAHDQVVTTAPTDGASVADHGPESVTITMSEKPLTVGTEVRVTRDGQAVSDGPPTVDGATITQKVTSTDPGTYQVVYRVTSADGHPVSGTFGYTVTGETTSASAPATSAETTTSAAAPGASGAASSASPAPSSSPRPAAPATSEASGDDQSSMVPFLLGVVGIILLGTLAWIAFARRTPPSRMD